MAWNSSNPTPYVFFTLKMSPLRVSGIELSILNNPRTNIGIPNFTIYGAITQYSEVELEHDIINNHLLTEEDHTVRQIILNIINPEPHTFYELKWNFNNLYNIDWFLLSEVILHTSISSTRSPARTTTASPTLITSTSGHVLSDGSIRLNCTTSGDGVFNWTWTFNDSVITDMKIYTTDMSRTGILIVPHRQQIDLLYGKYGCVARRKSVMTYSKEYILQFGKCTDP